MTNHNAPVTAILKRVTYSAEGRASYINKQSRKKHGNDRQGDGYRTKKYWNVRWDGCKGFNCYAPSYIMELPPGTPPKVQEPAPIKMPKAAGNTEFL